MYLRTCTSAEPITDIIDVLTRPDVPGKVVNPQITVDNGILLSWEEPAKQAGVFVNYYTIQWQKNGGKTQSVNVSLDECTLKVIF